MIIEAQVKPVPRGYQNNVISMNQSIISPLLIIEFRCRSQEFVNMESWEGLDLGY